MGVWKIMGIKVKLKYERRLEMKDYTEDPNWRDVIENTLKMVRLFAYQNPVSFVLRIITISGISIVVLLVLIALVL